MDESSQCVIRIERVDRVMLRVALEERLKTWERTRSYWEQVEKEGAERAWIEGNVEECNSLYEAESMCELWGDFYEGVIRQLEGD